jgi:hypothetical protein
MKQPFFHLCVLLSLTLITACAESVEASAAVKTFMLNPHELSPAKIQIDFDGDGIADNVIVSGLKGSTAELSKTVTLVRPWIFDKQNVNATDLAAGSKNNFYIVLSKTKIAYVVSDANPISILDTEAAQGLFAAKKNSLTEMGLSELNGKAKGDLLGIPTEAGIDTYLYWNGNTFISFEPLEVP